MYRDLSLEWYIGGKCHRRLSTKGVGEAFKTRLLECACNFSIGNSLKGLKVFSGK